MVRWEMPRASQAVGVRRDSCMSCGRHTNVQEAWVRRSEYSGGAALMELCRPCWRSYTNAKQVLTPQTAGRRRKKSDALLADEVRRMQARDRIRTGIANDLANDITGTIDLGTARINFTNATWSSLNTTPEDSDG